MLRILSLIVAAILFFLITSCADDEQFALKEPATVAKKESAVLAADPNIKWVVYRQVGGPGKPDYCSHAVLHSKETVGMTTKGVLTVFDVFSGLRPAVTSEKGAGQGKWEESWMAAGCP